MFTDKKQNDFSIKPQREFTKKAVNECESLVISLLGIRGEFLLVSVQSSFVCVIISRLMKQRDKLKESLERLCLHSKAKQPSHTIPGGQIEVNCICMVG